MRERPTHPQLHDLKKKNCCQINTDRYKNLSKTRGMMWIPWWSKCSNKSRQCLVPRDWGDVSTHTVACSFCNLAPLLGSSLIFLSPHYYNTLLKHFLPLMHWVLDVFDYISNPCLYFVILHSCSQKVLKMNIFTYTHTHTEWDKENHEAILQGLWMMIPKYLIVLYLIISNLSLWH